MENKKHALSLIPIFPNLFLPFLTSDCWVCFTSTMSCSHRPDKMDKNFSCVGHLQ